MAESEKTGFLQYGINDGYKKFYRIAPNASQIFEHEK